LRFRAKRLETRRFTSELEKKTYSSQKKIGCAPDHTGPNAGVQIVNYVSAATNYVSAAFLMLKFSHFGS